MPPWEDQVMVILTNDAATGAPRGSSLNVSTLSRFTLFIRHASHTRLAKGTKGPALALASASVNVKSCLYSSCTAATGRSAPSDTVSHAGAVSLQHTCAARSGTRDTRAGAAAHAGMPHAQRAQPKACAHDASQDARAPRAVPPVEDQ
jgi:hypothetical protein